jgi:hypothetical protein
MINYLFSPKTIMSTPVLHTLTTHHVYFATLAISVATGAAKSTSFLAGTAVCGAASLAVAVNNSLPPNQ